MRSGVEDVGDDRRRRGVEVGKGRRGDVVRKDLGELRRGTVDDAPRVLRRIGFVGSVDLEDILENRSRGILLLLDERRMYLVDYGRVVRELGIRGCIEMVCRRHRRWRFRRGSGPGEVRIVGVSASHVVREVRMEELCGKLVGWYGILGEDDGYLMFVAVKLNLMALHHRDLLLPSRLARRNLMSCHGCIGSTLFAERGGMVEVGHRQDAVVDGHI